MATTRYIATIGNDSTGTGTLGTPYKTLAKVLTVTSAGDTVLMRGGDTFRESVTKAIDNLTISSYGTGRGTISGADVVLGWATATAPRYSISLAVQPYVVVVGGVWAVLGSSATTLNNGEWFWASSVLYYRSDAGNPDTLGLVMEAGQRDFGINPGPNRSGWTINNIAVTATNKRLIYNGGGTTATGWTITNCTLTRASAYDGSNSAVNLFGCSNSLIQFNTFDDNHADNVFIQDGSNNVTIADNTFTRIGGGSLAGADCVQYGGTTMSSNGLITRNRMDRTGTDSPKSGVQLQLFTGEVSYNEILGGICGIEIDCSNVTVKYNIIHDLSNGVQSSSSSGPYTTNLFHHNVIYNVFNGMYFFITTTRSNHKFYQNTFYNCAIHGWINDGGTIDGEFKNNIIWGPLPLQGAIDMGGATIGAGGWAMDYNDIGPEASGFMKWTTGTLCATLAEWQTASGKDAHSISADPLFVSVSP